MRSLIELETFISVGEKAESMAKVGITDYESDSYKTGFVAHFKSLLRTKPYDFATEFLNELYFDMAEEDDDSLYFQYGYIKQFLKHLPTELEHALALSNSNHGGARLGSGRKKKEPTEQVRIPESLVSYVKRLKEIKIELDKLFDKCEKLKSQNDYDNALMESTLDDIDSLLDVRGVLICEFSKAQSDHAIARLNEIRGM